MLEAILAQKKTNFDWEGEIDSRQVYKNCNKQLITLPEKFDPCHKMSYLKTLLYNLHQISVLDYFLDWQSIMFL